MAEQNDSSHAGTGPEGPNHGDFIRLLLENQHRLFAYAYTLVGNRQDAEDLVQETSVVLWEKFGEYEPGTSFAAWAFKVASLKARNHHRKRARSKVAFSDEMLAVVSERAAAAQPRLDARQDALRDCLGKLNGRDRRMVLARYEPQGTVPAAAEVSGRSVTAAYKALARVRKQLLDCVTRRMAVEEA